MASQLRRFAKIAALPTCLGSYYIYHKTRTNSTHHLQLEPEQPVISHVKLPEKIDYLLVGGGTASHSAMRAIRCHDPTAKVLIMTKENHSPYMRPALSKELWFTDKELRRDLKFNWWNSKERSIFFEIDEFYLSPDTLESRETGGVSLVKNISVTKLDPDLKVAYLDNGQSIKYEKCLLAPGGTPKTLPALEEAPDGVKDKIIYFRTADDFLLLEQLLEKPRRIVIVGGGFLGSELACSLSRNDSETPQSSQKTVTQIFPEQGNLAKVLPEFLSQYMTKKIENEGCKVITNVELKSVSKSKDNSLLLKLSNDQTIEADYIICAVGLEPDVKLAKSSGLEVDDRTGGFLVNSELEARTNIWVAGDASCFYDIKLGRRRVEHHDHAVKSGGLAGRNMVGDGKAYTHQPMFWSDIGQEVSFEAVGLIDSNIQTVSVFSQEEKTGELNKGIVFYLKDDIIVGILLWNLFGRINIARRILDSQKKYDDFNEVAKLFDIHAEDL